MKMTEIIEDTLCIGALVGLSIVLGLAKNSKKSNDIQSNVTEIKENRYSDAVAATIKCSTFGSDANKIIKIIKKDENEDYYKAIISVVESDMFDSDKIKIINSLNE